MSHKSPFHRIVKGRLWIPEFAAVLASSSEQLSEKNVRLSSEKALSPYSGFRIDGTGTHRCVFLYMGVHINHQTWRLRPLL